MAIFQVVDRDGQKALVEVPVGSDDIWGRYVPGTVPDDPAALIADLPVGAFVVDDSPTWHMRGYELGEFYYFRNPTLRPGFQPAQGGLLQQAATLYPQIWAYLQTTEGQKLCTTEAEWQAMTQATWGDGQFKASWNGIGGAPYFVQDLAAGTLRMPDIRGAFACAGGDGIIAPIVGSMQGDRARPVEGDVAVLDYSSGVPEGEHAHGVFQQGGLIKGPASDGVDSGYRAYFQNGAVIPTGATIAPRSWGALACVYLGQPATT